MSYTMSRLAPQCAVSGCQHLEIRPRAADFVPVRVIANDYAYDGYLAAVFEKRSGAVRYVVEDDHGRLFIHNAIQLGFEEGWKP